MWRAVHKISPNGNFPSQAIMLIFECENRFIQFAQQTDLPRSIHTVISGDTMEAIHL